jgi:hypothetical protein
MQTPDHTAADTRYDVIEADLERDRDAVIAVWRGHIGWRHQLERMYDVFYRGCPHGSPELRLLRDRRSGAIVGTMGAGPRPMLWQGRPIRAAVMSHLAVLPEHRTVSPALQLARAVVAASTARFDFIYALPNAMSGAICRRTGFRPVGHLQRHVKLLRYRPYLRRVLPGTLARAGGSLLDGAVAVGRRLYAPRETMHADWTDTIDPRMQALWEGSDRGLALSTARTSALLEWRLLGLPAVRRRFLLVGPAADAPLTAWFACETNVRESGILTVTDAWSVDGVRGFDRRAVRTLCRKAYEAGFDAIETHLTAAVPVLEAWRAEGFVPRGRQPFFAMWTRHRQGHDAGAAMHLTDIEQDG